MGTRELCGAWMPIVSFDPPKKKTKNRFYPIFFKRLIHPELFLRAAPRFPCQKRIFNSSAAWSFPTFFFSVFFPLVLIFGLRSQ